MREPRGYRHIDPAVAVLLTTVYAFVHAAMQRPDAYTAAEKLTKPVWLVILGVAAALTFIRACSAWRSPPARPACIWSMCAPNFSTFRVSRASGMKALVAAPAAAFVALLVPLPGTIPALADPGTGATNPGPDPVFPALC